MLDLNASGFVSGSYGLFCHCSSGSKKPIVGNNLDSFSSIDEIAVIPR